MGNGGELLWAMGRFPWGGHAVIGDEVRPWNSSASRVAAYRPQSKPTSGRLVLGEVEELAVLFPRDVVLAADRAPSRDRMSQPIPSGT